MYFLYAHVGSICIEYYFDRHHGPLSNLSVQLLFFDCPFRRLLSTLANERL